VIDSPLLEENKLTNNYKLFETIFL